MARRSAAEGYWLREVTSAFLDTIGTQFPQFWRYTLDRLPHRFGDLVRQRSVPMSQQLAARQVDQGEPVRSLQGLMVQRVAAEALEICSLYRGGMVEAA